MLRVSNLVWGGRYIGCGQMSMTEKPSLLQAQYMLRPRMVRQHVGFCKKN